MPLMSLLVTPHRASGGWEAKGPLPLRPRESPEFVTVSSLALVAKGEGYSWGFIEKEMTVEFWAVIPEVTKPCSFSDSLRPHEPEHARPPCPSPIQTHVR